MKRQLRNLIRLVPLTLACWLSVSLANGAATDEPATTDGIEIDLLWTPADVFNIAHGGPA